MFTVDWVYHPSERTELDSRTTFCLWFTFLLREQGETSRYKTHRELTFFFKRRSVRYKDGRETGYTHEGSQDLFLSRFLFLQGSVESEYQNEVSSVVSRGSPIPPSSWGCSSPFCTAEGSDQQGNSGSSDQGFRRLFPIKIVFSKTRDGCSTTKPGDKSVWGRDTDLNDRMGMLLGFSNQDTELRGTSKACPLIPRPGNLLSRPCESQK